MNNGDGMEPNYRSRLVAKEFKRYNNPDLYTGTPPIEMLRFLVSIVAPQGEAQEDHGE